MSKLTSSNKEFHKELKTLVKKNPRITLADIGRRVGLTTGGVSWHMSALKKAKKVKRDAKGRLLVK